MSKFYQEETYVLTMIAPSVLCELLLLVMVIDTGELEFLFFLPLLPICLTMILPFSEVVYIDQYGITCKKRHKKIFSCVWEDVQQFKRCRHCRFVCVDVILKEEANAYIGYSPTVTSPNFFFAVTPKSKKAIGKYCPRADLLQQLKRK